MSEIYSDILQDLKKVKGVKMLALGSRDGFLIGEHASKDIEMLTLMSAVTTRLEKVGADRVIVDFNRVNL